MTSGTHRRILNAACVLALVALALMIWSLLDPHPIPVILAMSAAQMLGTASLGAFLIVVADDVRHAERKDEPEDPAGAGTRGD
jgi:hypothetical protein